MAPGPSGRSKHSPNSQAAVFVASILDIICLLKPKHYLSPFTSQSPHAFCGAAPCGGGVELGVRMWYHVKVLHIRHNLFAGTETISVHLRANRHLLLWGSGALLPHLGEGLN